MADQYKRIARYVTYGVLVTITLLFLSIYESLTHERELQIKGAQDSVRGLAIALSKETEASIHVAELVLLQIAEYVKLQPSLMEATTSDLHDILNRNHALLRRGEFEFSFGHLFVLREDGRNVANTVSHPVIEIDASDRPYFKHHKASSTEEVFISQPMVSKVTLERRVFLTKRLASEAGEFMGVVGVHLNLEHFDRMYQQLGLPVSGLINLIRTDGAGIYSYPYSDDFYETGLGQNSILNDMLVSRVGSFEGELSPFTSDVRVIGYRVSDKYPLVSVISLSLTGILSDWRWHTIVILSIFLAVSLVLLLVVLLVKRQISSLTLLAELSSHDSLTGVWNRREFDQKLLEEWRRASRRKSEIALLFIDIDFFKRYNDAYGHTAGDRCLERIAKVLEGLFCRAGEQVFRYGGEEFVVLLPGVSMKDAASLAQRALEGVRAQKIPHKASGVGNRVTVSIGVATGIPDQEQEPGALVDAADEALYAAKSDGRDRMETRRI